jgi:polyphosphate kinase 2 (PPK2 family)
MSLKLQEILDSIRVPHNKKVRLKDYDPAWAGDKSIPEKERKHIAAEYLTQDVTALAKAQELLYASDTFSFLVILQAMDAAGKDGIIKHVMSGVNPLGCQVHSFKQPSHEELDHNFLWRCSKALPERGRFGIFNRSYYEEVLIVKVHPELVVKQRLPGAKVNKQFWQDRYDDINAF